MPEPPPTRAPDLRTIRLFLDDTRPAPDGFLHVRTAEEAIAVMQTGLVVEAHLDNDLGGFEREGREVVRWMVEHDVWPKQTIRVHTSNLRASMEMCELIERRGPFEPIPGRPRWFGRVDERPPARAAAADRPLLLLDVDGVLCPFGPALRDGLVEAEAEGQPVRYDPSLAGALRRLAGVFALVWSTGWEHHANSHIGPLFDLPELPVIVFDDQFAPGESWKLPAIKRFVGERPFAWIDDDIGRDAHAWARERTDQGIPTLMLDIDPCSGLRERHVERLLDFAEAARNQWQTDGAA